MVFNKETINSDCCLYSSSHCISFKVIRFCPNFSRMRYGSSHANIMIIIIMVIHFCFMRKLFMKKKLCWQLGGTLLPYIP